MALLLEDVRHVITFVLAENRGNVLTDAMCRGLEEVIIFHCHRQSLISQPAEIAKVELANAAAENVTTAEA